jgi:hypothetical protein
MQSTHIYNINSVSLFPVACLPGRNKKTIYGTGQKGDKSVIGLELASV